MDKEENTGVVLPINIFMMAELPGAVMVCPGKHNIMHEPGLGVLRDRYQAGL